MAKLTKPQAKAHQQACDLLAKDILTPDEREFVMANWQESANHVNSAAGAFFTPHPLAMDFAFDVAGPRVIDLCAGIGTLSRGLLDRHPFDADKFEITCVEINPAYVEVGRKIVPEATWICADVFDVLGMDLGRFDTAISNPPFGRVKRSEGKGAPRYTGAEFEFHVIDIAVHLASSGTFIVPQMSAGFNYSGRSCYERQTSGKAVEFQDKFGLHFEAGCGVDTDLYRDDWHGVAPKVEIVCVDFEDRQSVDAAPEPTPEPHDFKAVDDGQLDMFGRAA